jgi:hypothetical protein
MRYIGKKSGASSDKLRFYCTVFKVDADWIAIKMVAAGGSKVRLKFIKLRIHQGVIMFNAIGN